MRLLVTTKGPQQRNPKALELRPKGVKDLSYFAAEAQPGGFLTFWKSQPDFSIYLVSCKVSYTTGTHTYDITIASAVILGMTPAFCTRFDVFCCKSEPHLCCLRCLRAFP